MVAASAGTRALSALSFKALGDGAHEQARNEGGNMTRFYEPAGREYMGEWFNRDLDYPERLVNTLGQDEIGTENPFWRCRQCESLDYERMAGIYWCPKCAREKREERSRAFYNSPEEKARQAAQGRERRKSIISKIEPGRLTARKRAY